MNRRIKNCLSSSRLAIALALCSIFTLSGCQFLQDEFFVFDRAPLSVADEAPSEGELGQ